MPESVIPTSPHLSLEYLREYFPALARHEGNHEIVYLDSASTTQKPRVVLEAERHFYSAAYANVHRGVYGLAQDSDAQYEDARATVQKFLNAKSESEIIFTGGTTLGLNVIAQSLALREAGFKPGDEILLTTMEHHANIVPWRMIADRTGAIVRAIPILNDGSLDMDAARRMIHGRTKVVSFTQVSNVLGTINPVIELCALARSVGAISVIDGAQAVSHQVVDVQKIGCDFYVFGGHKVFAPTGIGVVYGRKEILKNLPPAIGGGGMIDSVSFEKVTYAPPPTRFEAGTPPIAQTIGLAAALEWLMAVGRDKVHAYVQTLGEQLHATLRELPGVTVYGNAPGKAAVCAFDVEGIHPHDVATILGSVGVCVRAGHHCCMPLMEHFNVPALSRASLALYSKRSDIDALVTAIQKAQKLLGSRKAS